MWESTVRLVGDDEAAHRALTQLKKAIRSRVTETELPEGSQLQLVSQTTSTVTAQLEQLARARGNRRSLWLREAAGPGRGLGHRSTSRDGRKSGFLLSACRRRALCGTTLATILHLRSHRREAMSTGVSTRRRAA